MKAKLIFFISSTIIFVLSIIAICCAPIINKLNSNFESWKSLNCEYFSDLITPHDIELKDFDNNNYLNNLCRRQKAMYNLEYASLIISASLGFICFYLSLLLQLDIGREYKNKTGFIGFISGIICFILTLIYACFSGYIFNNDIAFGKVELNSLSLSNGIKKLFPNGAKYKWNKNKYINAYENDYDDYGTYIKYKDLGDKRYSYDNEIYKRFASDDPCFVPSGSTKPTSYIYSCDYIFEEPIEGISSKYLYDRWLTTLVLSCFISIFNIGLFIFGFSLFKDKSEEFEPVNTSVPNAIQVNTNTNNNNLVLLNENHPEDRMDEIKQKDLKENEQDLSKNKNKDDNELIKKEIDNKDIIRDKDKINKINKIEDTVNDVKNKDVDNKDVEIKKIEYKDERKKKEEEDKNKQIKKDEKKEEKEIDKKENKGREIKLDKININKIEIDEIDNNEDNENNQVNINNLSSNENNNNELISNENNEEDDDLIVKENKNDLILKENKNNLIDKESKDRINKEQNDKQNDVKERKESEIKHTDNKKDDDNKEPNQGNSNRNATDNNNIDINQINQMDINEGDMEII